MRIAVVCPYDIGKPGGVQQLSGELASHLRRSGDEVVFVGAGTSWFHGGPGLDEITVPAGRAVSIRANESGAPITLSPTHWRSVRRRLAEVDVVHIHEPLVPVVGWMALSVVKPTVATFHADAPGWASTLYQRAPWVTARMRESIVTAVSRTAADSLPEKWGEPRIVPNAIDVASYSSSPTGRVTRRVAFLGRDDPRKGLSDLLAAWPEVRRRAPDAELIVMGAERPDDIEGARFVGPVSGAEKRRLLASSQVYVAPNKGGESFGIVLIEAMAAGCAVVATDLPAFQEVTGGAAVHVPVGDVESMAGAISDLLVDEVEAERLSRAGRERASRYDWPVVVARYRELYAEAVS